MRVLYLTSYQGPDILAQRGMVRNRGIGGSRKVELLSGILQRAGHDVVVLSAAIPADRTGRRYRGFESTTSGRPGVGARVLYADGWDARFANHAVGTLASLRTIAREVAKNGPFDVLFAYNIEEFIIGIVAWYWRRIGRAPLVLEYEDSVVTSGRGVHSARQRLWLRFERWLQPRLRGVVGVNPGLVERLKNPNSYVLRGVVSDALCARAASRVRPLGGQAPFTALFSGSLAAGKGIERIIEVAPRFRGRVRFMIAGAGPLEQELRQQAGRGSGDVEITGFLSNEELQMRLTSADLLLNPHDHEESGGILPFKIVEYLAAGGVVVTTRSGVAHDEVFDFCEVTEPESFGDAIERVLAAPAAAADRAEHGRRWAVERYSETAVTRHLTAVFDRAVGAACTS